MDNNKIYAVCLECDDNYYGYLKPQKVFSTRAKAEAFVREQAEDGWYYGIFEYTIE